MNLFSVAKIAAYAITLGLVLPCHADDSALSATLQSRYTMLRAASDTGDIATVQAILTPDYVTVRSNGAIQSVSDLLKRISSSAGAKASDTTILSVSSSSETTAIVSERTHTSAQIPAAGGTKTVDAVVLLTDTWVNDQGTWQLKQAVVNQASVTVNGKQMFLAN